MTLSVTRTENLPRWFAASRLYYGWVIVFLASIAMVGTLPGRTQGLGLITEPLLRELKMDRVAFAQLNLWATLLGALCCYAGGRFMDRRGARTALPLVCVILGAAAVLLTVADSAAVVFIAILLSRAFGQSALSVVSISMVGQWFRRRLTAAMATYTVLLSIGFMIAFPLIGWVVQNHGWKMAWAGFGCWLILGLAPLSWFLTRQSPESCGVPTDGVAAVERESDLVGATLGEALRSPAFWVFGLSAAAYNLVASGVGLFNESILNARGFAAGTFYQALVVTALTSLIGNFLAGWLADRWSQGHLMAIAMLLLGLATAGLPMLTTLSQVYAWAAAMGIAGGFVMVIFFGVWARFFGRKELGRIQGAAQALTVLSSAVGPLMLAKCVTGSGSYAPAFQILAVVMGLLAVAALLVKTPQVGTNG